MQLPSPRFALISEDSVSKREIPHYFLEITSLFCNKDEEVFIVKKSKLDLYAKPYNCKMCSATFMFASDCNLHVKNLHSDYIVN